MGSICGGQGTPNRLRGQAFFVGLKITRAKQRIPFGDHSLRKMARAGASAGFVERHRRAARAIIVGHFGTICTSAKPTFGPPVCGSTRWKKRENGVAICLHFDSFPSAFPGAGVAQLVEHHLAKVTVESSSLFARSILFLFP